MANSTETHPGAPDHEPDGHVAGSTEPLASPVPDGLGDQTPPDESPVLVPPDALPFELPDILHGLEGFVRAEASRLANPDDPTEFERAVRYVVGDLEHRVSGYYALGRIATNKGSLPAKLVAFRPVGATAA